MRKHKVVWSVIAVVGVVAVLALEAVWLLGPSRNIWLLPPTPQQFGHQAMKVIDSGVYASGDEWQATRREAVERIGTAMTQQEVVRILQEPVKVAGGPHSRIYSTLTKGGDGGEYPQVSTSGGIATLVMPGFRGAPEVAGRYADQVAEGLRDSGACGVILDLRENWGGSGLAMLPGLAGLLPDGEYMRVVIPSQPEREMIRSVENGGFRFDEGPVVSAPAAKEKLNIPVALLVGSGTASAGEQVLLAFKGLPYAKSFGTPTMGIPTFPAHVAVRDVVFQVVGAIPKDRTGQMYWDEPVNPDVEASSAESEILARAWLAERGCPAD